MQTLINRIAKINKECIIRVPNEYKDEFIIDIYKENLFRLVFCAVFIIIVESVIFTFMDHRIFNTGIVVASAIIFNIILLPILYIAYKKINLYNRAFINSIQFLWLTGMLFWGCALSLVPHNGIASVNAYIIVAFGIAAIVYTPPIESLIVYCTVYVAFYYLLPYYQIDSEIVQILQGNTFVMNIFAWSLSRFVYRMKMISFIDKKIIEEKNSILKNMLSLDSMTSLLNHKNMLVRLDEDIERAKRINYPLSIIMMDIDGFKYINDQYGHQVGDQVIIKMAQILINTCRSTDRICRYGGDEFVIILPDTSLRDTVFLSERIGTIINETEFMNGLHITVSGGISEYSGESAEELIASADLYLYSAKANGKNRFEFAELKYSRDLIIASR